MFSIFLATTISACGEKCKVCRAEVTVGSASVSTAGQELCGDDLKKAESTPGMVCKDK